MNDAMMCCGGIEAVIVADMGSCDTMYDISPTDVPGSDSRPEIEFSVPPSSRVPSFGVEYDSFFGV